MIGKFCWRCRMEVKMLDDDEFILCREAWFNGKKVVEEELLRRNIKDYVWLDKIETFEQFRYLLEMYKIITGEYESNPNAILHHHLPRFRLPLLPHSILN